MSKLIELKSQAYDLIGKIEAHSNEVNKLRAELAKVNELIGEEYKESEEKVAKVSSIKKK